MTEFKERRDFFRITQDVHFDYKIVDSHCVETEAPVDQFDDAVSLSLLNELKRLDKDNIQSLRLLTEKNRLLGDYLQSLSSKIDLIARHSLFAHDNFAQSRPKTRINISEDGLAFMSDRAIYKDSYIVVRLVFLPYYVPVTSFAKVIRSESKDDKYQNAAKFHRLADADRQELSKQILRAQTASKRYSSER